MNTLIKIHNIFSIGYRCTTDIFLQEFLFIRNYSSPFSYMVIDIETSLKFIENKFENYTNTDCIQPGKKTFKFNKQDWKCSNIHKCSEIKNDNTDILDMNKVCIWNHHNLYDQDVIKSLNRRTEHLLRILNTIPDTLLLFYIEKLQIYDGEKKIYFNKNILNNYNCNFLIIIPLLHLNKDPYVYYEDTNIKIIYFDSNFLGWSADINSQTIEEWNKLKTLLTKLYDFDIQKRNDD